MSSWAAWCATAEPLVRDSSGAVYVLDRHDAPELVDELGELRDRAHKAGRGRDDWRVDAYDDVYHHLVIVAAGAGNEAGVQPIGGFRFALADDGYRSGGLGALRSARGWEFSPEMVECTRRGAEIGRVWIAAQEQRNPRAWAWLWAGLVACLDRYQLDLLFGQAEFAGNGPAGLQAIVDFCWRLEHGQHELGKPSAPPRQILPLVVPRRPAPATPTAGLEPLREMGDVVRGLRELQKTLARTDPEAYASPWMQWIRLGAQLAGPPGAGEPPNQVVALVMIAADRVRRFGMPGA